jgi:hypothetical protein
MFPTFFSLPLEGSGKKRVQNLLIQYVTIYFDITFFFRIGPKLGRDTRGPGMFPLQDWNHYEELTSGLALTNNTSEGKIFLFATVQFQLRCLTRLPIRYYFMASNKFSSMMRIRIRGSMAVNTGSGSSSGSWIFLHFLHHFSGFLVCEDRIT